MRNTILLAAVLTVAITSLSKAEGLTVSECMNVESGLIALGYSGAQLRDQRPVPPDAKQYRLGNARWPIALSLSALSKVSDAFAKSRIALILEIGEGKGIQLGTPEMSRVTDALQKILDKPCEVTPARIRLQDLNLGDGPDQNPIPPNVLSALAPIIDDK